MSNEDGIEHRLVRRYPCRPIAVELVVVSPNDRPLRRSQPTTRTYLARISDVSVTGLRVEMLAEPRVPVGGWVELAWDDTAARVDIRHRELSEETGLLELGLGIVDCDDHFRTRLHDAVRAARGGVGAGELEAVWRDAR